MAVLPLRLAFLSPRNETIAELKIAPIKEQITSLFLTIINKNQLKRINGLAVHFYDRSMARVFFFNIAIGRYKLIVSKFYKAFITTRNNDPVAFDLAAFNGK